MFGYVVPNKKELSPEEDARYRAVYCGLCHALQARHGHLARFVLQYDFAFLTLLLDSLYEPEVHACARRCAMHPFCARRLEASAFTDYAADMTIALVYYKCLDDWQDEHKLFRRLQAKLLKKRHAAIALAYPEQCAAMRLGLEKLERIEGDENALPDEAASAFGEIMAALFAPRADRWESNLSAFGMALGRFLYIMDAWDDCDKDARRSSFNPLANEREAPDFDTRSRALLTVLLGECTAEFEKLPLVADIGLMRNVIYSGVWTRFEMKRARKEARRCR